MQSTYGNLPQDFLTYLDRVKFALEISNFVAGILIPKKLSPCLFKGLLSYFYINLNALVVQWHWTSPVLSIALYTPENRHIFVPLYFHVRCVACFYASLRSLKKTERWFTIHRPHNNCVSGKHLQSPHFLEALLLVPRKIHLKYKL